MVGEEIEEEGEEGTEPIMEEEPVEEKENTESDPGRTGRGRETPVRMRLPRKRTDYRKEMNKNTTRLFKLQW